MGAVEMARNNTESGIPKSDRNEDPIETGYIFIGGIYYYKRIYHDGCAELVRYDESVRKWIILCFTNKAE